MPVKKIRGIQLAYDDLPVARLMSDNIPGAQLVCIEGAGRVPAIA